MGDRSPLTPYPDVDATLAWFLARIRAILGPRFRGMYLDGSLALGDFSPHSSDIDFLVTTDSEPSDALLAALHDMHTLFNAGGSPWVEEVEAVYIAQEALHHYDPFGPSHLRIERGQSLVREAAHSAWLIHWWIVREHGVVVAGPHPAAFIGPIDSQDLRQAMGDLGALWLEPARHDRAALRHRGGQTYTVLTLCRMLYTLHSAAIVSKPVAARWAQATLDERWATLIERALAWRNEPAYQDPPGDGEIDDTIALMEYTLARCRLL